MLSTGIAGSSTREQRMEVEAERIPKHARHRVERTRARARYDRDTVHAILDAGMLAHVAFCVAGQPFAIPMLYAREGDTILLHG
jgi:hypothetical protein